MSNLVLEVILEMVDRLTGPARDAAEAVNQLGSAVRGAGAAEGALRPDAWVEQGRAIGVATKEAKAFDTAINDARQADASLSTASWLEQGQAIVQAMEKAKEFETSIVSAADAEKALGESAWIKTAAEIDKATAAVNAFAAAVDSAAAKAGPGGAGGRGGKPGGGGRGSKEEPSAPWQMIENAGEMIGLFEGLKAVEVIVGGGAHLTSETIAQRIAGMTQAQIDEARMLGLQLQSQFPQFPITEILKEAREARAIFNTDEEAREALPDYLKMAALVDRAHPGEGLQAAYPYMRAVEESGATNTPGKAHEMFEAFQRAENVFGAKIKADDYQQVFQHGGAFARQWNMTFIRDELPHLLASIGGDATGTMVATLGMAIAGGHVMGPALREFDKLGLLDEKKVHRKKNGDVASIDAGAIQGIDILANDPVQWVNDVLWPAIQKTTKDPAEQEAILTTALSNRNDLKAGYMAIHDKPAFQRDANLVESQDNKGLDASGMLADDPTVGWQKLKSSIESLASVASEPLMEPLAAGLDTLAGGISHLTKAAADHPVLGAAGATAAVAAFTYWSGKAFSMIPKWLGKGSSSAAGGETGAAVAAGDAATVAAETAKSTLKGGVAAAFLVEAADFVHGELMDALGKGLKATGLFDETQAEQDRQAKLLDDPAYRAKDQAANRDALMGILFGPAGYGENVPPEAAPGSHGGPGGATAAGIPAAPKVDAADIDAASTKARKAGDDLKALGDAKVAPKVDSSAIDALLAKLREAAALVGTINGGVAGASARAGRAGALHDGPETQ